jgi:hypothetical protein
MESCLYTYGCWQVITGQLSNIIESLRSYSLVMRCYYNVVKKFKNALAINPKDELVLDANRLMAIAPITHCLLSNYLNYIV